MTGIADPAFMVLDQPSQVYFSKRLVPADGEEDEDLRVRDEDVKAVRMAFQVMGQVVLKVTFAFTA